MKFKGIHPQTGATLWGCPKLTSDKWVIEWFEPNGWGLSEGETKPKTEELAWIKSNISAVDAMQEKVKIWREKVDDIPF